MGAIAVPILGNLLAVAVWLPLLRIADESHIRPMLQSVEWLTVAAISLGLGGGLGATLITRGARFRGWLCVAFSITPVVVGLLVARIITDAKGLIWAP